MTEIRDDLKFYEQPFFINIVLLLCNAILFTFKLIFGILTNSLALQADAYDNLTDIITDFSGNMNLYNFTTTEYYLQNTNTNYQEISINNPNNINVANGSLYIIHLLLLPCVKVYQYDYPLYSLLKDSL